VAACGEDPLAIDTRPGEMGANAAGKDWSSEQLACRT